MPRILRALSLLPLLCLAAQPAHAQKSAGDILPVDGNASANWKMAGMLSVGGIPNRSTVCANVEPRGSDEDDTGDIQAATFDPRRVRLRHLGQVCEQRLEVVQCSLVESAVALGGHEVGRAGFRASLEKG